MAVEGVVLVLSDIPNSSSDVAALRAKTAVLYAAADGRAPNWVDFMVVPDAHAIQPLVSPPGFEKLVYELDYDSGATSSPGAFALLLGCTPPSREEMLEWHDGEHFALLRAVPGWVRSRRYRLLSGAPPRDGKIWGQVMLLHEWTNADAFASEEFEHMIGTEWRGRFLRASSDLERRILTVYKVIH